MERNGSATGGQWPAAYRRTTRPTATLGATSPQPGMEPAGAGMLGPMWQMPGMAGPMGKMQAPMGPMARLQAMMGQMGKAPGMAGPTWWQTPETADEQEPAPEDELDEEQVEMPQWALPTPALSPQFSSLLMHLLHTIESAMPMLEVLHSLHDQAHRHERLAALPTMRAFDAAAMAHLHATIAVCGYIRRLLSGDRSDETLAAFKHAVQEMIRAYDRTHDALTALRRDPAARENRLVASMARVMQMRAQVHAAILPMMEQVLSVLGPAPER